MVNYTHIDGSIKKDVKLFALSTCGWCKRTRKYLDEADIAYSFIYVDELHGDDRKEALEEMKKYDKTESFPTIAVGDKCIIGFDKKKLDNALKD